LVDWGFRPVPLYNAVPAFMGVVNLNAIMELLVDAAERIGAAPSDGPPAFLLDANRSNGAQLVRPGVFDNRSVCRESDFPSAETLWKAGIRRGLLIQSTVGRPAIDLESVLATWQQRGIELWKKNADDDTAAAPFRLRRRWFLSRFAHAVRRSFLRRRADEAYGMIVPDPTGG
jgi:hypothetical protein